MSDDQTFRDLGLDSDLTQAVADLGFETPTPVQSAVIPRLLAGAGDLVCLAQTGTGKTAAFGLPVLQQVKPDDRSTQVLILCPTRELCLQIAKDLNDFCKRKQKLSVLAAYGGTPIDPQIRALRRGAQVVVATPGRLNDLLRRKAAALEQARRVILDEADEMLSMGFEEDLELILKQVPDAAQILLFSATMPKQVAAMAGKYMKDPEEIILGARNAGAENVTHVCYMVHAKDRYLALKRVADFYPGMYGIVFCRTRVETQEIADKLATDGYDADALHGDLTQAQRDRVMDKFRLRNLQMLVATDVAARGLDVNDLTHIINFNLPDDLDAYTHRSGRTGRAGKSGVSVVIINMREKGKVHRIEKIIGKKFEFGQLPSGREVCEAQLIHLARRVKDVAVDHRQIDKYLPEIEATLSGLSREDLVKQFVSLEFNRFLDYYRGAPDLNARAAESGGRGRRGERGSDGFTELFIGLGRKDRLTPKDLMALVNDATPGKKVEIGRINILDAYSFFEVVSEQSETVTKALAGLEFEGRDIKVSPAEDRKGARPGPKRHRKGPSKGGHPRAHGGSRKSGPAGKKRWPKKP